MFQFKDSWNLNNGCILGHVSIIEFFSWVKDLLSFRIAASICWRSSLIHSLTYSANTVPSTSWHAPDSSSLYTLLFLLPPPWVSHHRKTSPSVISHTPDPTSIPKGFHSRGVFLLIPVPEFLVSLPCYISPHISYHLSYTLLTYMSIYLPLQECQSHEDRHICLFCLLLDS